MKSIESWDIYIYINYFWNKEEYILDAFITNKTLDYITAMQNQGNNV